ncbi:hypothetical protein GCM10010911_07310 [Paenibacillus nasutitermitis]|uniref:Uncharacterized protein n=1 Tax=Paenibacillus nasutitermitis TaxID=1652958 RepID=A0A917DMC7_9BACL|nr:hypothetical protein GCM10010911_07310 [Paenibacillus nasutitermitis]
MQFRSTKVMPAKVNDRIPIEELPNEEGVTHMSSIEAMSIIQPYYMLLIYEIYEMYKLTFKRLLTKSS